MVTGALNNSKTARYIPPSPVRQSPLPPPLIPSPEPTISVQPSSAKSVQFDLNPETLEIPSNSDNEREKEKSKHERDSDLRGEDGHRDKRRDRENDRGRHRSNGSSRHRDDSVDSAASDETVELPPRFDQHGRRKDDDPLAKGLEQVLSGLFR